MSINKSIFTLFLSVLLTVFAATVEATAMGEEPATEQVMVEMALKTASAMVAEPVIVPILYNKIWHPSYHLKSTLHFFYDDSQIMGALI